MTHDHSALLAQLDALKSADSGAVFAELIRAGLQALIEAEATAAIGAGRYERADGRIVHRNGHRPKTVATTAGDIEVRIPKLRSGSFFPACWNGAAGSTGRCAVIMEAYVHGVSTRSVDDLVAAMGVESGVSKSEVSRICSRPGSRDRGVPHPQPGPHAVPVRVRRCDLLQGPRRGARGLSGAGGGHRGVHRWHPRGTGDRGRRQRVLRVLAGVLASLKARGLSGVHLVISDAHAGLKSAVAQQFSGASWQRCRVHFMRNLHTAVAAKHAPAVTAAVKTIFALDPVEVAAQWDRVALGRLISEGRRDDGARPRPTCWRSRVPASALAEDLVE